MIYKKKTVLAVAAHDKNLRKFIMNIKVINEYIGK